MSEYAAGTPSWVDVMSPYFAATEKFYGALFGWTAVGTGSTEQAGEYKMFMLDGKYVAGGGPLSDDQVPPHWNTYINVDDADASAAKVRENGGQVLVEPMDVMTAGRMAVCADPTGATFSLWQPINFPGSQLVNEPGTLCWNELNSRDPEKSKAFYAAVFGWQSKTQPASDGMEYTEFHLNEKMIAGMFTMTEKIPPEVPPHWMVYFAVADADATAKQTEDQGGKIIVPATEVSVGRFVVLTDPQGITFSVIQLKSQTPNHP